MVRYTDKLSSAWQVYVPLAEREAEGIEPGDELEIEITKK